MPPGYDALDSITRVLAPYLGATMARAAVRAHAERLGVQGNHVSGAEIDRLLEAIGPGLGVFVGRDETKRILDEVRAALAHPASRR